MAALGAVSGCTGGGGGDGGDGYDNYPDDDVRWIVPYGTGGGFDLYSRFLAEHMPEYLPGDGNIVVENVTGAGGQRGATELYNSDPDGYTLGIYNIPGMIVAQFIAEAEYRATEMTWLGTANQAQYGILVTSDSEYETLTDLQETDELSWGMTGPGGTSAMVTFIAAEVLEINSNFVMGYDGGEDARAGMLRGEVDARMNDFPSAESHVRDGEMRYVVALSRDPPDWVSAPTVVDEGYEQLADLGLSFMPCGPPGMDEELQGILSDAMMQALQSDEAQAFAEETDRPVNPIGPEETAQIVENSVDLVDQYQSILAERVG
ncbi:MAG: tripartite tricarboxylate transporter substrate-binding protein [Halobacteriales archaeon]|nr:tripartite tricarboxylate transporter substrate-binding protein [Halobacteriales archaeon]